MILNKKIVFYSIASIIVFTVLSIVFFNKSRPSRTIIDVPFTSQAPIGDWSEPWANACEETTIYMVSNFYQNEPIKRDDAVKRIKQIFKVKNKEFKVSYDESLETIANLIKTLDLPWTTRLIVDPTAEDLKKELAGGRPIIVPIFAPSLWNENFKGDGPDYHVVALIGYDDSTGEFIANDPGTANGQGRRFAYTKFMGAIHDLNSKNYRAGQKAVLFTEQLGWNGW